MLYFLEKIEPIDSVELGEIVFVRRTGVDHQDVKSI